MLKLMRELEFWGEIVSTRDPFAAKYQEKERSGKRKPQVAGIANLTIVVREVATNNNTPVSKQQPFLQSGGRVRS